MNYLVPNNTGLNYWVQALQRRWYEKKVQQLWGVNDSNYNCFGLAVRNKNADGFIPQYFDYESKNYLDGAGKSTQGGMFFEDTIAALSFFSLVDPTKTEYGTTTAKVQWVFFVDLKKITPGGLTTNQVNGQRAAEIVINDVRNFVQLCGCGFRPHDVNQDIDNVLKRYSGVLKKATLIKDMYPNFCFTLDMSINYDAGLNTVKPLPQLGALIPQSLEVYIKDAPDTTKKIQVGYNQYINQEYAAGSTLTLKNTGDANGFLAGRRVLKPFIIDDGINEQKETGDGYNGTTGVWDGTARGGFMDGEKVTITALVNEWN